MVPLGYPIKFSEPSRLRKPVWCKYLHTVLFAVVALRKLKSKASTFFYTRNPILAIVLGLLGRTFLVELHTVPARCFARTWMRFVSRRAFGIVLISHHLADDCVELGANASRMLVGCFRHQVLLRRV